MSVRTPKMLPPFPLLQIKKTKAVAMGVDGKLHAGSQKSLLYYPALSTKADDEGLVQLLPCDGHQEVSQDTFPMVLQVDQEANPGDERSPKTSKRTCLGMVLRRRVLSKSRGVVLRSGTPYKRRVSQPRCHRISCLIPESNYTQEKCVFIYHYHTFIFKFEYDSVEKNSSSDQETKGDYVVLCFYHIFYLFRLKKDSISAFKDVGI